MTDIASKEIAGFYSKYAKAEGITLAEAKQRLSAADIAEYARKAEQYVPDKDFSDKANEEMRLYNAMMSINRLEMLKSSIGLGMVEGFDKMDKSMREGLTQAAIKEFERQAGILGQTVIAPLEAAQAIVDSSFHNATFSERIWLHQDMLRSELEKVLTEGLIMGVNSRVLARHISKVFGASQKDAERLMRTEISRVCTEAQKLSYERNGYEQYEIVCEPTACDQCMPLNGEHYFTKDMRAGDNAPPFHPNCHCTTCAYEDLEAFEKWLDYKDKGGEDSWEEWNYYQVNGHEDTAELSGKIGALDAFANGMSLTNMREINREIEKYVKENPQYQQFLQKVKLDKNLDGDIAIKTTFKSGKLEVYLLLNPDRIKSLKQIDEIVSTQVADGYWTQKNGLKGILNHEAFGHLNELKMAFDWFEVNPFDNKKETETLREIAYETYLNGDISDKIVKEAFNNLGIPLTEETLEEHLKKYAAEKWKDENKLSEAYAEAMSDESNDIVSKEIKRLSGV